VQPLVQSVRTDGEHSVFVLGGEPVAQVRKLPRERDPRARGVRRVDRGRGLDPEAAALARRPSRSPRVRTSTR
jgi:hypothetical protein